MKKFSVLSLALLLAAGTGFAGRPLPAGRISVNDSKQYVLNAPSMADEVLGKNAIAKAPARIPVNADKVTGTYTWNKTNLQSAQLPKDLVIDLVDAEAGKVEITGWLSGSDLKVAGVVDFEKGELSIPNNQYIGVDSDGYPCYFYVKDVVTDEEDGKSYVNDGVAAVEATVGRFNGDSFVFPPLDVWTIGDPNEEEIGFWVFTYANSFVLPLDEEQVGMWNIVGPCTIEDAWIIPSYTMGDGYQAIPANFPFTAELQQNVYNENLYRVWRPFWSDEYPLIELNQSAYNGQIVFDVTDPDHVIVKSGYYAGFANQNGEFCVFGMLGWQIGRYGNEWDPSMMPEVIEFMEERSQPFDTFKDNILTVNYSVFDFDITCASPYSWQNNEYVVSKITFPAGVSAVNGLETVEAPVKYYNLQGVEVADPAAGQIVICRQGGKAVKKIIK